jgi:uncharacterized protein (DUF2252 family)
MLAPEAIFGAAAGRAARRRVPLARHAEWTPPADRPDPIELLEQQGQGLIRDLLPTRYGRMLTSPLAFYRGAAAVMASDLAGTPVSGIQAQLCGDAHAGNFGGFAPAEHGLVFDINDFDETLPGPWEWDVKRLAASLEIAARQNGAPLRKRNEIVRSAAATYQAALREFSREGYLEVWYGELDLPDVGRDWRRPLESRDGKGLEPARATARDNQRAAEKHVRRRDGRLLLASTPPLVRRFDDLMPADEAQLFVEEVHGYLEAYRKSLSDERRHIFDAFEYRDMARKVVGVGGVGVRTDIVLFADRENAEPLVLQLKEASRSVLEPYLGKSEYPHSGRRIVEGQRLIQASDDVLLGWARGPGVDGIERDFYVRQLWDWKVAPDIEGMKPAALRVLGEACAWTLARAHALSGDRAAIAAYLGRGGAFAEAIERFAAAYADQNRRDYEALLAAVDRGRIIALRGA